MKSIIIIALAVVGANARTQAVCDSVTANLKPQDELLSGTYNDSTGGLYFQQTNTRPAEHDSVGKVRSKEVAARLSDGTVNWSTGKIGWILIGMSSMNRIGSFMKDTLQSSALKAITHPLLVFKNCAKNGVTFNSMVDTTNLYWTQSVPDSLTSAGLTTKQVGVVFFHHVMRKDEVPATWPRYPDSTRNKTLRMMRIIQAKFPNCKQLFINSREYSNYTQETDNHNEPDTYWHGFGQKWAIDRHIKKVDSVSYVKKVKANGNAPWTDWLTYNWANGTTTTGPNARSDGLTWQCANFEPADGLHTVDSGRRKIAIRWINKMKTDATMRTWFLRHF